VEVYLIGQAKETIVMWGKPYRTGSRKNNIVGVYLIGQPTENVILWGFN